MLHKGNLIYILSYNEALIPTDLLLGYLEQLMHPSAAYLCIGAMALYDDNNCFMASMFAYTCNMLFALSSLMCACVFLNRPNTVRDIVDIRVPVTHTREPTYTGGKGRGVPLTRPERGEGIHVTHTREPHTQEGSVGEYL